MELHRQLWSTMKHYEALCRRPTSGEKGTNESSKIAASEITLRTHYFKFIVNHDYITHTKTSG